MNRYALPSLAVVGGLAAVLVVSSFAQPDTQVQAQAQPELRAQPAVQEGGATASLRPGQLEDPGPITFNPAGWSTDFSISAVPFIEIISGGPPKDGIPAIDDPVFESIAAARGWLDGNSPVIALEIDGDARAYPLAIVTWHEIVNDTVGDVPVVVTFCPLCNTALAYDRTVDGVVHDFGVSGVLRFSDLVMYDRQTETWWQQATGFGIVGDQTGTRLPFRVSQLIGLDQFAEAYPDGMVLSRDTGHNRRYGANPYPGYDTADQQPFLFVGETDGRIAPKERVVTLGEGTDGIAFPHSSLRSVGAVAETVGDKPIVVFWEPGSASALGSAIIDESEDIGSTGVFSPVVDGQQLTFTRDGGEGGTITDEQTGSTWTVTGRAIDGPLAGTSLEPIGHANHFWFAWAAFAPETRIWTPDGTILFGQAG